MKKITLLLMITVSFFACKKETTSEERFKEIIEPVVIENLNDPKSYEFVSVSEIDTFLLKDTYKRNLDLNQKWLNDLKASDSSEYANKQRKSYIEEIEKYKSGLDTVSDNSIDEIGVTFKYRANNKLGGLVLSENRIYFDDNFNITRVKE